MDVNEDAQRLLVDINQLEEEIAKDERNLEKILKITELYLRLARPDKSITYLNQAFDIFKISHKDISISLGLELVTVSIKHFKHTRYENKTKINASTERLSVMNEIWNVLLQLSKDTQLKLASNGVDAEDNQENVNNSQIISCKMAYMKECLGNNSDALAILSDLIASHAVEAVDLSYVIFKAAIILKHIGQNKQSIEYLEFLLDDPPVQEGYTKLHIVAFLILLYEQSGDKYKVFLHQKYKDLKAAYAEDLANKKVSTANNLKKLNDIIKSPVLATSSEIWEIFAMQALEKCEYIMALELLQQAVIKTPTKGKLFLVIAEIYNLLKKPEQALKNCEKAAVLIPSNEDCRNMLLMLNPDKYTEKLRSAAVINVAVKNKESAGAAEDFEGEDGGGGGGAEGGAAASAGHNSKEGAAAAAAAAAGGGGEEPANWIGKVKSKATGALKAMHENGVAATILSPIVAAPTASAATATGKSTHAPTVAAGGGGGKAGKNSKTSANKKGATVHRGKQTEPRPVVARPVPQEEVQEEQVDQGNKYRPKKPVLDSEAQRMLRLILSGNQNVHFYDASMKALADVRAPKEPLGEESEES